MSNPNVSPLAGKPAPSSILVHLPRLLTSYYSGKPDPAISTQRVAFGTSGHRGTSFAKSFNEDHIAAISQALAEYRIAQGINGPLFLGIDTHALSEPAQATAIEVLAANGVDVILSTDPGYTPTPVISHAILKYNAGRTSGLADGIVVTPSHNPPQDGGFKYNPPNGGPADTDVTAIVEKRANQILEDGLKAVKRIPLAQAKARKLDLAADYIDDLANVINLDAIRDSGIKIGVDPLGNASVAYWPRIAEKYKLNLEITNPDLDFTFRFMTVDWDGKIRMDCSSPYAMAGLVALKDKFDIAFANDTDADRHGIVTPTGGLMNPNHYLSAAIYYLFQNRPEWSAEAGIGKTLVSSSMIDQVAKKLGRKLVEVPVGFKWFVDGLYTGTLGFGGEESAGASFLRKNGTTWTTDKDGPILGLLAAEILAVTGKDPHQHYLDLTAEFGSPVYERIDAAATPDEKNKLKKLSASDLQASTLAGDAITATLTEAPGNGAALGGLKVCTDKGWFAARPSGTEDVYKIYAESFVDKAHLERIQTEAKQIVSDAIS